MLIMLFPAATVWAGEAQVVEVTTEQIAAGIYRFDVTVKHADAGWEHYVNKWDIVGSNDEIIATRILYHPHVNEQPFTRSLSNVKIPDTINRVTIRAHDSLHGYGERTVTISLPQ